MLGAFSCMLSAEPLKLFIFCFNFPQSSLYLLLTIFNISLPNQAFKEFHTFVWVVLYTTVQGYINELYTIVLCYSDVSYTVVKCLRKVQYSIVQCYNDIPYTLLQCYINLMYTKMQCYSYVLYVRCI